MTNNDRYDRRIQLLKEIAIMKTEVKSNFDLKNEYLKKWKKSNEKLEILLNKAVDEFNVQSLRKNIGIEIK